MKTLQNEASHIAAKEMEFDIPKPMTNLMIWIIRRSGCGLETSGAAYQISSPGGHVPLDNRLRRKGAAFTRSLYQLNTNHFL